MAGAFGFDETEIKDNLGPHLKHFSTNRIEAPIGSTKPEDGIMEELKSWYDGYRFNIKGKACNVLNPVSMMKCLREREFQPYWSSTGSIDYLVKRYYEDGYTWDLLKLGDTISLTEIRKKHDPLREKPSLRLWMLLFGYYTISSYDESKKEVSLKLPNKEIEVFIQDKLASYDPEKQAFYKDYGELNRMEIAFRSGNTEQAMMSLANVGFTSFEYPLTNFLHSWEVSRRLAMLFKAMDIQIKNCAQFQNIDSSQTAGEIDLQTTNLRTNYIIEIKCVNVDHQSQLALTKVTANKQRIHIVPDKDISAFDAINQSLYKMKKYPKSYMKAIGNQENFTQLGLAFNLFKGVAKLADWVAVPFRKGVADFKAILYHKDITKERLEESKTEYDVLWTSPTL